MTGLRFSKDHEYLRLDGDTAVVGITDYAQEQLGDVVFVEIPETGKKVRGGTRMSVIESVKAVSDIYSPVSGTVVEVNEDLADAPELVNQDCYGKGWIVVIEIDDLNDLPGLMTAEEYQALPGVK